METSPPAGTEAVRALVAAVGSLAPAVDDVDRIERVRLFEELKSVAAAAQAVEVRDFDRSQRALQAVQGVASGQLGRGVAAQIGLARRVSPWSAQRYLGWCRVLPDELPETFVLLRAGRISEWRATLVARETIWLSRAERALVDAELAPRLAGWGDRQVEAEARRAAYRLDPQGSLARVRGAVRDRRVTLRAAPDAMARLTALLPVAQGVAAYTALCRAADSATAGGEQRGRGQVMADTLVERVTGQTTADAVAVEVELLITTDTLFADAGEPAELIGYGPLPGGLARDLALGKDGDPARRRIRRLFTDPVTGQLVSMQTRARLFTAAERRFIRYRNHGTCRTPWCGAPIRHADHVQPAGKNGKTHVDNGQGLCAACNYAKQAPGWRAGASRDGSVEQGTPTGHRYRSRPPQPPGSHARTGIELDVAAVDLIYLHGRVAA